MIRSVRIESEQITLPIEVIRNFAGKEILFIEFQYGFFLRPVSDPIREARGFLKKAASQLDFRNETGREKS